MDERVQNLRVRVESGYLNFESGSGPGKFLFSKPGPGTKASSPGRVRVNIYFQSREKAQVFNPPSPFLLHFYVTNFHVNYKFG